MTSARLLEHETSLMEQEGLELRSGEGFKPAFCLTGTKEGDLKETCVCIQVIDLQTRAREDLQDTSWPNEGKIFIDGSSSVIGRKRVTGYAIVKGKELQEEGKHADGQHKPQNCLP